MTTKFKGVVGGVTYTDPALFETAARDLGYDRRRKGRGTWKIGTPIAVRLEDGTKVSGQVWSYALEANYVWLALDTGKFVCAYMPTRKSDPVSVYDHPTGRTRLGKVAA